MLSLALVLVYAILMGFWWNLQKRDSVRDISSHFIRAVSGLGAGLILIPASVLLHGVPHLSLDFVLWESITIALNILIAFSYVAVMKKQTAALGVHVSVFGPMIAIVFGFLFLQELPNWIALTGMVTMLLGTYVLHTNPQKKEGLLDPIRQIWKTRASWLYYALVSAICSGIAIPIDKKTVLLSNKLFAPGLTLFVGWGLFYLVFGLVTKITRRKQGIVLQAAQVHNSYSWSKFAVLMVIAVSFAIANGFQGTAYLFTQAALVGALKRMDSLVTVLLAYLLFHEQFAKWRIPGAIIIATGAILIGLSNVFPH